MRVYYFTSEEFALSNLQHQRVKISRIEDLNDPYELRGFDLRDRQFRKAYNAGLKSVNDSRGIICFSKSWKNPLMWSHYADKHKGICLGFDIAGEHLKPVDYVDSVVKFDNSNPNKFLEYLELGEIEKLLTLKYKDWMYEKEVRLFVPLEVIDVDTKLYFYGFEGNMQLREVILGHRNNLKPSDFKQLLSNCTSNVSVFKSRIAFGEFCVIQHHGVKAYSHQGSTP